MALDWVQRSLRENLGFSPYPGTLNLRLETDEAMELWREVRERRRGIEISALDPLFCQARCFPVEIEGKRRGAVILPDVGDYPADKMEVIAPVRLKEELQLRDGAQVTVEFMD